jgi:hypothetical protein
MPESLFRIIPKSFSLGHFTLLRIDMFHKYQRVRTKNIIERFPHFTCPCGAIGTIVSLAQSPSGTSIVQMDKPIKGCEQWDNKIHCYTLSELNAFFTFADDSVQPSRAEEMNKHRRAEAETHLKALGQALVNLYEIPGTLGMASREHVEEVRALLAPVWAYIK